ncbi:MAG: ankyrin repeat domain-containing protein [Pseudonocardia sp.]|nr:ankyrin repeat domain-containing protein [Pseudonocardia sp.]
MTMGPVGVEEDPPVVTMNVEDELAVAVVDAIRGGDVDELRSLLEECPWLATAWIDDSEPTGTSRSLLHILADWPGHRPRGPETVAVLVEAGAVVDARFRGAHIETPLHWAASCDDVAVLDALLDAGADIEAPGAVLGGGSPLADACGFKQWAAAHRLVERGARTSLFDAATLGLTDRVRSWCESEPPPTPDDVTAAFWGACHGGRRACAEYLLERGADLNWIPPWERATPLDAAERDGAVDLVARLFGLGARRAG